MYYQNSGIIKMEEKNLEEAIMYVTSLYDDNSQMQTFPTECNHNNE